MSPLGRLYEWPGAKLGKQKPRSTFVDRGFRQTSSGSPVNQCAAGTGESPLPESSSFVARRLSQAVMAIVTMMTPSET